MLEMFKATPRRSTRRRRRLRSDSEHLLHGRLLHGSTFLLFVVTLLATNPLLRRGVAIRCSVVRSCLRIPIPSSNCSLYASLDDAFLFVGRGLQSVRERYPTPNSQVQFADSFLSRFCPPDLYTRQVIETLALQLFVGLRCGKLWATPPAVLASFISEFQSRDYYECREKYRVIDPQYSEVFYFRHGLRRIAPHLKRRLKSRSIIDIGAFQGDSALVLSEYGKDVYSIELAQKNVEKMREILRANVNYSWNVHVVHAGVASRRGHVRMDDEDVGGMVSIDSQNVNGMLVPLMTIDEFAKEKKLSVGFIKADVEGFAFDVVLGAIETLKRDRPIFSISCYHSFNEMYNVSTFLMAELHDYQFEWHMENTASYAWFELSFFGYPKIA